MSDMSKFKVGANTYDIKDEKSRGVPLTWAQYQALSYEEQHNGTAYYITDMDAIYPVDHELNANSGNAVANDVVTPHILAMENVLGAKNLLPVTLEGIKSLNTSGSWSGNVYTYDNMTFTIQTDNFGRVAGISVYGRATDNINFVLFENDTPIDSIEYAVTTGVEMEANKYALTLLYDTSSQLDLLSEEVTFTPTTKLRKGILFIWWDADINTTFKPMIRPVGTDPTWVPYAMTNEQLTENTPNIAANNGLTLIRIGRVRLLHFEGQVNLITGETIAQEDRPSSNITATAIVSNTSGQYHRMGALTVGANGGLYAYAAPNYDAQANMDNISSSSTTWIFGDVVWVV